MASVLCPVVVGRASEFDILQDALRRAQRGVGSAVLLIGQAGIGKSRLARELAREAETAGMLVMRGRAAPGAAKAPFRPFAEALAPVVDEIAAAGAALEAWLPALSVVVPGLRPPHLGSADTSPAERGESVVRALSSLAEGRGGLLLIEDLHWADADTLALVEHLTDNLHRTPVLCVVTLRPEEATGGRDLARVIAGRRSAVTIELGRLTDADVIAMVGACTGEVDSADLERVVSASEGVPFLVEELLASPGVPETFADSVHERLGPLAEETRSVLASAATLGRHFDWHLLSDATGLDVAIVADALEHGMKAQLLTVDGDSFRFRHALTREAVLGAVSPARRPSIAAAALDALERARPSLVGSDREIAAALAERAEQPERAGVLYAGIGVDALAGGALASSAIALERATQLLPPGTSRTDAGLALVTALAEAGRVDDALAAMRGLLLDDVGEARAMAHLVIARAAVATTRWELARTQLALGREHVGDEPRLALRAELAVLDGELAFGVGDIASALDWASVAFATAEVAGASDVACEALLLRGRAARTSSLEEAQAAFTAAAEIAEAHKLRVWELRSLHELGTIDMFERGDGSRLERARAIADEVGALATSTVLDIELSANYTITGDDERSIAHGRAAMQRAIDLGQIQAATAALNLLGTAYIISGDREAAHAAAGAARRLRPDDEIVEATFVLAVDALAALLDEDRQAAADALDRGMTTLNASRVSPPASHKGLWPLVLAVEEREDEAREAIAQLLDSGATVNRLNLGYLQYTDAVLAGRRSPEEAADCLARGDDQLRHGPFWHQLGRRLVAEAASRDGWGEPKAWSLEAGAYFSAHGHAAIAAACRAIAHPTTGASARTRTWAFADLGVTRREADVLALVCEGLANKDIAVQLFVSPRTVEKHLESLLRKVGARSRTHLATLAGQSKSGAL